MLAPHITDVSRTKEGCRTLTACYPAAMTLYASRLPDIHHDGVHYVPYTGRLIRHGEARGFFMEYRALREKA